MRLMCIGAHPDDCDSKAAGLAAKHLERGGDVLFLSLTNGNAGHHQMQPSQLAERRRREARQAAESLGRNLPGRMGYRVLEHDDGRLTPSLEVREELIGIIREFGPDLLLGPRPFDYHADHRAAGVLLMDASYLLTVPLIRPDVPAMRRMPVIAYTADHFQRPYPFRAAIVINIDRHFDRKVRMFACHESQAFEWLPYNGQYLNEVPADADERLQWLMKRFAGRGRAVAERWRALLVERYGPERGASVEQAEAFEICEYGRQPQPTQMEDLFPG